MTADRAETDRLENYLAAVFELKYNISHIEKKYPFLGNELSSLCEETIVRISRSAAAGLKPDEPARDCLSLPAAESAVTLPEKDRLNAVSCGQTPPAAAVIQPHSAARGAAGPVTCSLDAAGGILITALDKMGDGIIVAFEKVLWLGQRLRRQSP